MIRNCKTNLSRRHLKNYKNNKSLVIRVEINYSYGKETKCSTDKIKNGEVVSNEFENEDNDKIKRKSNNAERQLTAKEKLRIMLLEADRKDQITMRIAQEIE